MLKTINFNNKVIQVSETGTIYIDNKIRASFKHATGYLYVRVGTKNFPIHRIVAEAYCTKPETTEQLVVHHIDHTKLNNHYTNLQWMTAKDHVIHHRKNKPFKNAKRNSTTKLKGVYEWNKGVKKYRSAIQNGAGQFITIGYFYDFESAAYAFNEAHKIRYGTVNGSTTEEASTTVLTREDIANIKSKIKSMGME